MVPQHYVVTTLFRYSNCQRQPVQKKDRCLARVECRFPGHEGSVRARRLTRSVATLLEEKVRMSLVKIAAANFLTWNLCGNSEDGNTAAVTCSRCYFSRL